MKNAPARPKLVKAQVRHEHIVDEPTVCHNVEVTGYGPIRDDYAHSIRVELSIYDCAGENPLYNDVAVSLDLRRLGAISNPIGTGPSAHEHRDFELSVFELEPFAAALARVVEVAKAKGLIPAQPALRRAS